MTAATIPRIRAAEEPARIDASLDGADVEADDGDRVAELWVDVVVKSLKLCVVVAVLLESVLDSVAELKVEFRTAAVPVPIDPLMPVTVAVELPNTNAEVLAVEEAVAALPVEEDAEPPLTEKRPE